METKGIIRQVEDFVKHELESCGSSHDWHHIERVRKMALMIGADQESKGLMEHLDMDVVEIGSLMHDVGDWKYSGSETIGMDKALDFFKNKPISSVKIHKVLRIIKEISYRSSLSGENGPMFPELAIVQDADRLDALGAIGIARAFGYGGEKNRPLYLPEEGRSKRLRTVTKEEYNSGNSKDNSTVNHFYVKLFRLKDTMHTRLGRQLAQERHKFMEQYIEQFYAEWDGDR